MLPSSSLFENLPARPPTPPRDASKTVNDAISLLGDSYAVARGLDASTSDERASDTPLKDSHHTSQEQAAACSSAAKKVGFTPVPTYLHAARVGEPSSPTAPLGKFAPSNKDAMPLKSILKQSAVSLPLTPDSLDSKLCVFSPQEPGSFAKMLQSVVEQLAGRSVSGRLDAYLTLNGALKAYEGVPNPEAMVAKMSLLMQFMTRDMAWKNTAGALDANIVTQALKLAASMIFDPQLSAALDDDFRTFLIDRSINVMEHTDMPKALIKTHMYLLAQQRFQNSVMTTRCADKIISALHTIEERCSGNNVIVMRLMIYQRLLEQAPAVMLNRMRDWLEHVFHSILSSAKDTRIRAIETCTLAAMNLGIQPQASKALLELFQTEVDDNQSYSDYFSHRLTQMIRDKETGACVPQIWSAVVLFFRNRRLPLEKWSELRTWLLIIQKCLNSSDSTIAHQGYIAWNKLVFTVMPGASTSRNMFGMLKLPPTTGMDKRSADKHSKQVRQFALDSYYNLLHYALRPGLSYDELDSAWDVYVEPVLSGMIKANSKSRYLPCRVLHGLCSSSSGLWNFNAANESNPIKPADLPKLEPKWVRSRLAKTLKLLEPIIASANWTCPQSTSAVHAAWHALMQSVADAGSQEVKTSNELKEALAVLINHFQKLWGNYSELPAEVDAGISVERYADFISTSVQCIGAGPFAENILTKARDDTIQAAPTPSHRSSEHRSAPISPFVYLFGLLYTRPSTAESVDILAPRLLHLQLSARSSALSKVELLLESLRIWSTTYEAEENSELAGLIWKNIADSTTSLLQAPRSDVSSQESQCLGLEARNASSILAEGMRYIASDTDILQAAIEMYLAISRMVKAPTGAGGAALAVVEPASKALLATSSPISSWARIHLATSIVRSANWPHTRDELDQAHKTLWGVRMAPHRANLFDPFDQLYHLITDVLICLYKRLDSVSADSLGWALAFISSVMSWLKASPPSLIAVAVRRVQEGLAVWIADAERKTNNSCSVSNEVQTTWRELLQLLQALPEKDSTVLKELEPLLVAGFSSPHKAIVNQTIVFWDQSFGCSEPLEYPARLRIVLRARLSEASIRLPGFPFSNDELPITMPPFFESQDESTVPHEYPTPGSEVGTSDTSWALATEPVTRIRHFGISDMTGELNPASSPIKCTSGLNNSPIPKARLRHDDSQVHFVPIESSPICNDSQVLTEHQREVKARQKEDAQMFPDWSSSPADEPLPASRSVQKRIDFTLDNARTDDEEPVGTPPGLPDIDGPMSDDMPSSPTPSSGKDAESAQIDLNGNDHTNDGYGVEPPSSPPRRTDDVDHEFAGYSSDTIEEDEGKLVSEANIEADNLSQQPEEPTISADQDGNWLGAEKSLLHADSDLSTDTRLRDTQSQSEEQATTRVQHSDDHVHLTGDPVAIKMAEFVHNVHEQAVGGEDSGQSKTAVQTSDEGEIADTETFVHEESVLGLDDTNSNTGSQNSVDSTRKRKSSSPLPNATKKRKPSSPLKRIFSSFLGRKQQEEDQDDGDIQDEIVVASSQASSSPARAVTQRATQSLLNVTNVPSKEVAETTQSQNDPTSVAPQKRGRGRPKKSALSTQEQPAPARNRKRSASRIAEPASTKRVTKSTAASKVRKQRESQDVKTAKEARVVQEGRDSRKSRRRAATGVILPRQQNQEEPPSVEYVEDSEFASPDKQLEAEQAAALEDRPIVTPRSVLGRLKGVLSDLPKIILGYEEERQMDDVLFEIRRELHKAGQRGKE